MKYGFVKVAAATPAIRVADPEYNAGQILPLMQAAAAKDAALVVFPELCLTGYTCGDLFLQSLLLDGAEKALAHLLEESRTLPLVALVGLPVRQEGGLYNCAAVFSKGRLLGVVPKSNLPNYSEFYEQRHFTPAPPENGQITLAGQSCPFGADLLFRWAEFPDFTLAAEICEDLWVSAPPSVRHAMASATVIANLSASDEIIGKAGYRRALVGGQSARLICGYIYADAGEGESTTDMVFSGHNLIAENGLLLAEAPLFQNELTVTELDISRIAGERRRMNTYPAQAGEHELISFSLPLRDAPLTRPLPRTPFVPEDTKDRAQRCGAILSMQSAGLRKRLAHTHAKTAVIGVSGGLDSTLALLVSVRAMKSLSRPLTDILAVTMPCFGTTSRTKSNAVRLCEQLGVTLREVDITKAVRQHFSDISQPEDRLDVTFENSQARERTQVLMDLANQTNGLVVGTGDLSELALGWATYNGDHMSMYGVNASVPKTLVRHLVRFEAESTANPDLQKILLDILDTPVSPELLPPSGENGISQKTEELVGPYELHDFYLYYLLRFGFPPRKLLYLAEQAFTGQYPRGELLRWLTVFCRRFFAQQFKRSCLPDGPKVGSVALSPRGDWRMPSDASAALWLAELESLS